MSENEKRLRALLGAMVPGMMPAVAEWKQGEALRLFDALLAEHRAEVEALQEELKRANQSWASARDAALEEAAGLCSRGRAASIYALKSQPARQYVDAETVREVLENVSATWGADGHHCWCLDALEDGSHRGYCEEARRLCGIGVDLDAESVSDDGRAGRNGFLGTKDTHTEHCCQRHGCKYGDAACTVTSGKRLQSLPCAECEVSP